MPYGELINLLLESSRLLLKFVALSAKMVYIFHILMLLFQAHYLFIAVGDFFLVVT